MSTPTTNASDAPYTLVEVGGSCSSPAAVPFSLSWTNLSVSEPVKSRRTKKLDHEHILDSVSGEALPGEILAIVGPTGGGQTALLNCLAHRIYATSGSVRIDGQPWRAPDRASTCFLPRDNLLFATLTAREHIWEQARFRLGHLNGQEQDAVVNGLLAELDLFGVADMLIQGPKDSGLDASQRKMLGIATELLTSPSILFLEEPFAGLDIFKADRLARGLQKLKRKGHTIVLTAECPASAMFAVFDKIHVLAGGRTVYRGKTSDSIGHFKLHGLACPSFMNPFEFFNQTLTVEVNDTVGENRILHLVAAWSALEQPVDLPVLEDTGPDREGSFTPQVRSTGVFTQLSILTQRNVYRIIHDTASFRSRSISMLGIAAFVSLIFLQLSISQINIQSFSSACYLLVTTQLLDNAVPELFFIPGEVTTVLAEHRAGLYNAMSWYVVKNVTELPLQIFYPMLALVPAYFLVGFTANAEIFFTFALFLVLVCSTASGMVYFFSCAVRKELAFKLALAFILPCSIFGGPFVNSKTTPVYLKWLQQMSPVKYGYHGTMRAFWSQVDSIYCAPGAVCRASSGHAVLRMNIIKPDKFMSDWLILLGINIGFRVAGGVALWLRARKN